MKHIVVILLFLNIVLYGNTLSKTSEQINPNILEIINKSGKQSMLLQKLLSSALIYNINKTESEKLEITNLVIEIKNSYEILKNLEFNNDEIKKLLLDKNQIPDISNNLFNLLEIELSENNDLSINKIKEMIDTLVIKYNEVTESYTKSDKSQRQNSLNFDLTNKEQTYLKTNKNFNVCTRYNHYPLSAENNGKITGISGEVFEKISKELNITFNAIGAFSDEEFTNNIKSNKCELVTTLRKGYKGFENIQTTNNSIIDVNFVSIGKIQQPLIKDIVHYENQTFYILKEVHQNLLRKIFPKANIIILKSEDEIMKRVKNEKDSIYFTIDILADYIIDKYGFDKYKIVHLFKDYEIQGAIGVNMKKVPQMLSILDKTLTKIGEDKLRDITDKYKLKTYNITSYQWLWYFVFVLFLVFFIILYKHLKNLKQNNEYLVELECLNNSLKQQAIDLEYSSTNTQALNEELEEYKNELKRKVKEQTKIIRDRKNILDIATKSANFGVWTWNLQTNQLEWDDNMYAIYEVDDTKSLAFDTWENALHPEDKENIISIVQYAIEHNCKFEEIFRIITKKNKIKYIKASGLVYFDNNEPLYMIGTNQDITKTIELQNELTQSNVKLSELFNLSSIGIALNDMKGKFIEVNNAFEKITGYTKDEINKLDYWSLTPKKYENEELKILKSLKEKACYGPYEKEYIQKNGNLIPINLNGVIVEIDGENYIWSLIEDISQKKEHERILESKKILEQEKILIEHSKMASIGEMMTNIAHQWKQPLATISAINAKLSVSQELGMLNDKLLNSSLSKQNEQIKYLSNVISTFNEYLSPNSFKKQEVVVQKNIDIALSIVSATLKDNHIEVINRANDISQISIETIPNELSEVLINILNNAKDILIEKNIEDKQIIVDLQNVENKILITIEDNAGGVPDDAIHHIFEPYFTTKHKSQGTGLGLHICYNIIVKHLSGEIYVKNTEKGAKFYIQIPIKWGGEIND